MSQMSQGRGGHQGRGGEKGRRAVAVKGRVGRSVASRPGSVHPISGPTGML